MGDGGEACCFTLCIEPSYAFPMHRGGRGERWLPEALGPAWPRAVASSERVSMQAALAPKHLADCHLQGIDSRDSFHWRSFMSGARRPSDARCCCRRRVSAVVLSMMAVVTVVVVVVVVSVFVVGVLVLVVVMLCVCAWSCCCIRC